MTAVTPLQWNDNIDSALRRLRAGDAVEITGRVMTLRNASAGRLAGALAANEPLPYSLARQVLYAVGPSPARPGQVRALAIEPERRPSPAPCFADGFGRALA